MPRWTRLIAPLLAGALLMAACGGSDSDDGGAAAGDCPVDALEGADGPVDITVWHSYVGLTNETINQLADEYNASQDQVQVTVESQGQSYEELLRKYRQAIPSGDLPAIGVMEDTNTQFLADSGTIIPAGECAEADGYTDYEDSFLPAAVDFYSVDDVLQPASFNLSTVLLYYNREHFEAAGLDPDDPPGTLAEMQEAAQAIADAGVVEQPVVLNLQPWFIEFWTTGAGAGLVDNDNGRGDGDTEAGAVDNESTREVFEIIDEMNDTGLLNPVPGTEGQFDHYFAMGLQQASMMIETSTAVTTINAVLEGNVTEQDLEDLGIEELPPIDVDLDAGPFPGLNGPGEGQLGGGVWYITNGGSAEQQAAAWDFTKYVNQPENQVLWHLQGSYLPPRQEAVDDPAVQDSWENTRPGGWLATAYDGLLAVDPDWPGPLIGPYTETRTAVRDALDEIVFADSDVGDAVATADATITDAIATYNDENF